MGSTGSMAMVVNQIPKLRVGGVVAVSPCKGLDFSSQQLHGTTTPVMQDCCQSTTTTLHYKGVTQGQRTVQGVFNHTSDVNAFVQRDHAQHFPSPW